MNVNKTLFPTTKLSFSVYMLLMFPMVFWGQLESANWYFGNFAGINFSSGSPIVLTDGAMATIEGCATISGANGNLLFYTDGQNVYNANHVLMPNGSNLLGGVSSSQSAIIVPKPGSGTLYYVFTVAQEAYITGLNYSVVDMTLDGGMGDVLADAKNIPLTTPVAEKLTAVTDAGGQNIWVLAHKMGSNEFLAYLVTDTGVSTTPVISQAGAVFTTTAEGGARGCLKASPNGKLLACALSGELVFGLQLLDFDNATGTVSNAKTINNHNTFGVEFSPDSNMLYASSWNSGAASLHQYNIGLETLAAIQSSEVQLLAQDLIFVGSLQLALDGKIYVSLSNLNQLAVIKNPGVSGTGCNFVYNGINLGSGISSIGLPDFVQSSLQINIINTQGCYQQPVAFEIDTFLQIAGIDWDFGDPDSGGNNESSELHPTHVFSGEGTFLVKATITTASGDSITVSKQVAVIQNVQAFEATDMEECEGQNSGFAMFNLTQQSSQIVGSQNPAVFAIAYYLNEDDAQNEENAIVSAEIFMNTVNPQQIYARVDNTVTGCHAVSSFLLKVNPKPTTTIAPLYSCDDDGDGYATFLFNERTSDILNGQMGISVTYYESMENLEAGIAPLPNAYVNTVTPSQIVFVKLKNVITGCETTTTLQLMVAAPPVANQPNTMPYCDPDNDGFGEFDLETVISEVVPDNGSYVVTFHETDDDAVNGVNAFSGIYENIVPDLQTMYVRMENAETGCFDVVSCTLLVEPTPVVPDHISPLEICDDNFADGIAEFDLTDKNAEVYGGQLPENYSISYYLSQDFALAGEMPLPLLYSNAIPYQQTIYVRLENNITGCTKVGSFKLIVHGNPVLAEGYDHTLSICDDFGEVGDETQLFDLTVENEEITGNTNGYVVTYFETQADAHNNTNPINNDTAYQNTQNPQTLYVRVSDINTDCASFTTVTIRVLNNPTPLTVIEPLYACDDDADGDANNGQAAFNLTLHQLALLNGEAGVTPIYYETYEDALAAENAIANPNGYYNIYPYRQTIYVAVSNNATGCLTIVDFDLVVHPLPEITDATTYYVCETDNNHQETFPLTDMDGFVMDGGDSSGLQITYHATEAAANLETAPIVGPLLTVSGTGTVVARVENTDTGCFAIVPFSIEIRQAPAAVTPSAYMVCETLNADGFYNDGVEAFNLNSLVPTLLAGQDPTMYTVTFYVTEENAYLQTHPLTTEAAEEYISGTAVLYAVVTNNETGCTNGTPVAVELVVEELGEVVLVQDTDVVCVDATNNPVIGTNLGAGFAYLWNTGAETPTIEVTEGGEYFVTVVHTNSINQCIYESNHLFFEEASLPGVTPHIIQSAMFSSNNTVEVITEGAGISEYGYILDSGMEQTTGLFENVEPGVHTVTITELHGCGRLEVTVNVIDYMKYFTPNGDGVNDTWRIIGLESQPNAQVFIFDRYGKLLKQKASTAIGWDGTYNGTPMPSEDYWFKVIYTDINTGTVKEFANHFALKR